MKRRHGCLLAVLLGSVSAAAMQNFITVGLPTVAAELNGGNSIGWVFGAYMLASTAVLLLSGRLGDFFGPRVIYVTGTAVYIAGTVLVSQAQSMTELIGYRAIQGIGSGMIVPAGMAAVARYWRGERLGKVIGVLGATQVAATLVSAPVGGWLTSHLGWRVAFLSATVVSVVALLLSFSLSGRPLRSDRQTRTAVDILREPEMRRGLAVTAGLASLTFGAAAYLPVALVQVGNFDAAVLGWMMLPLLVGNGIGSAIGGAHALHLLTQPIAWSLAAIGSILCIFPTEWSLVIGGALVGAGVGIGLPSVFVRVQEALGTGNEVTASAFIQFARNLGGGIGVPVFGVTLMLPLAPAATAPLTFLSMLLVALAGLVLSWNSQRAIKQKRGEGKK